MPLGEDALTTLAVSSEAQYPARMRILRLGSSLALAALFACSAPIERAAPPSTPMDASGVPAEAALEARRELARVSVQMTRLSGLAGDWDVTFETLDPSGNPTAVVARGTASLELDLGGRLLCWATELEIGSVPVAARGLLSFDVERGLYQLLWVSELASGLRIASGGGDPDRGGIYLEIAELDPESGALVRARTVLRVFDADNFTLVQWGLDPLESEWVPQRRTSYRRKARASAEIKSATTTNKTPKMTSKSISS